jgi:cytochrome c peroxidase
MGRLVVAVVLAVVVGVAPAGDRRASVPKDTLPADLSLAEVPLGLEADRPVPKDNPLTPARVRLGRRLFFDPILSADRTVACASCHDPTHGFASPAGVGVGIGGRRTARKAPTLFNRAFGKAFFWDGRETSLEAQALRPIANPDEMGDSVDRVVRRLREDRAYAAGFGAAFPDGLTAANLARALASFERVLLTGNSRVDRFRAGDLGVLDDGERHGLWLFESRGQCWRCHAGRNFTDETYHNTGVGWGKPSADAGRHAVTHQDADRGRFKTPTLRGLAHTAPYMHDGSLKTLQDVVEFYNRGGVKNPNLDPAMTPLGLSKEEVRDLVAFLRALSDTPAAVGTAREAPAAPPDKHKGPKRRRGE